MRTGVKKIKNSPKIISFKSSCRFEHFFILAIFSQLNILDFVISVSFFSFVTFSCKLFIFACILFIISSSLLMEICCSVFLFQKFVNVFFIVITINAKSLCYFLSFLFIWSCEGSPISSNNDFLAAGGFPFAFNNRFFQVFECGSHITFACFLPCPMDTFMSPESK